MRTLTSVGSLSRRPRHATKSRSLTDLGSTLRAATRSERASRQVACRVRKEVGLECQPGTAARRRRVKDAGIGRSEPEPAGEADALREGSRGLARARVRLHPRRQLVHPRVGQPLLGPLHRRDGPLGRPSSWHAILTNVSAGGGGGRKEDGTTRDREGTRKMATACVRLPSGRRLFSGSTGSVRPCFGLVARGGRAGQPRAWTSKMGVAFFFLNERARQILCKFITRLFFSVHSTRTWQTLTG